MNPQQAFDRLALSNHRLAMFHKHDTADQPSIIRRSIVEDELSALAELLRAHPDLGRDAEELRLKWLTESGRLR